MPLLKKPVHRRVDFFRNASDLRSWLLFTIGLETSAIALMTGLTKSQVTYRYRKVEQRLRDQSIEDHATFKTARKRFRQGEGFRISHVIDLVTRPSDIISQDAITRLKKERLWNEDSPKKRKPR